MRGNVLVEFVITLLNITQSNCWYLIGTMRGCADISGWLCDRPYTRNGVEKLLSASLSWSIDPACPLCFTCIFVAFHFIFVFYLHIRLSLIYSSCCWSLDPAPCVSSDFGVFFLHLRYHLISAGISQWTMLGICILCCSDHKVGYLFCKYRSKVESSGVGQR